MILAHNHRQYIYEKIRTLLIFLSSNIRGYEFAIHSRFELPFELVMFNPSSENDIELRAWWMPNQRS